MTLLELLNEEDIPTVVYSTGIDFIDDTLEGGFELGQFVTFTGEQEAGKTQIVNQILCNVANGFKCLYFSLEFNKKQVKRYFKKKLENKTVTEKALKNIFIVTNDMIDSEISNIIQTINYHITNNKITFIALDSTLMLYHKSLTGEQETTDIFRQLHSVTLKNDVLMFVITQGSKQDNKDNRVSIFGSQKANHFANIMLHLTFDRDKDERQLIFAKNKQTGTYKKIDITFDKNTLMFEEDSIIEYKKQKIINNALDISVEKKEEDSLKIKKIKTEMQKKGLNFE